MGTAPGVPSSLLVCRGAETNELIRKDRTDELPCGRWHARPLGWSGTLRGVSLTQRFWITLSAVALIVALVLALVETRPVSGPGPEVSPTTSLHAEGSSGIGDPYLPDAGGGGYDVQHYDVQITANGPTQQVQGTATITAVATRDLDSLHLDLHLSATRGSVNGVEAALDQNGPDLTVTAPRADPATAAIRHGDRFTVSIDYAGFPGRVQLEGSRSWYRSGREFVIAGEPEAAALWYPSNDHPRDAATMQFTVSVPKGTEAICAGLLLSQGRDSSDATRDLWVWQVDAPTVTYATFLAVGQYRVERGVAKGRPYVYAVSENLPAWQRAEALRWLRTTPAAIEKLEKYLGPYPFSGIGGFVSSVDFEWGGLETAMRPVYHNDEVGLEELLNHELAHMWLGDTVTLYEWNDIFNNEALTSYAEWLTTAGSNPKSNFKYEYQRMADNDRFWRPALSDLGVDHLFERVYDRGPMAVHALRNRMGDQAFFALLKNWAQQQGPRSLEDFRRTADEATPEDLTGFFAEWLDQTDRPAPTLDNGVPG